MDSKRHQLIKQLFHRVVELDGEERDAVLGAACRSDQDLRKEVEELLAHSDRSEVEPLDKALASSDSCPDPSSSPQSGHDSVHGRFLPGAMLGTRYRIVGLLGKGGMGEVYRADDLELGQSVALKFLPESVATNAKALERFRREVRVAREVAHANVCRVYDIGEQDGHVFLSMEFVDGDDLSQVLRRLGRPSPEKAVEIARQICLGLAAAHERGVLHRDLKPANVMIDGRGRVRITDFGLAGLVDELAATSERAGTPAYMAPEQLAKGEASLRSDVYSLGLLLYELVTGRPAYEGDSLDEILSRRSSGSITSISTVLSDVDPAVERAIDQCLQEEPQDRPPSAYAVLAALPGGDPLAAAMAAGETPSPELVASAIERGGLRPSIALSLLIAVIGLTIFIAVANDNTTALPPRPGYVLSLLAEQKLAELGIAGLPEFHAEGFNSNGLLLDRDSPGFKTHAELESTGWPPPYRFWRRWSKRELRSEHFHGPEAIELDLPPRTIPGDVSVVLDPHSGRLLDLMVVPEQGGSQSDASQRQFDGSALLVAAGVSPADAQALEEPPPSPAFCDATYAWDVRAPDGESFQAVAGTHRGELAYFRLIGVSAPSAYWGMSQGEELMFALVFLAMVVPALRNARMGRGDRRSAFRFAVIMAIAYALIEVFSARNRGLSLFDLLRELLWLRAAGHVMLHAFQVWVLYMAIEPYVRRMWPKMLVGWVRLLSGSVRDPVIGRELLIGSLAGSLGVAGFAAGGWCEELLGGQAALPVHPAKQMLGMSSHAKLLIDSLYNVSASMLIVMHLAAFWLVVHIVTRRHVLSVAIGLNFLILVGLTAVFGPSGLGTGVPAMLFFVVLWLLLYTRVGLLSAFVALVTFNFLQLPISTDLSAWHSAWTLVPLGTVFGFAAFGCWVALAGQPIFRDVLSGPPPSAKAS